MIWVPITLLAATFQILRTARQHRLRRHLSVNAAGFVRYAYGFPLALVAAAVTFGLLGGDVPSVPLRFWPIVAVAGVAQIVGTVALLRAFDLRDFAIGTVYSKTEVIQVAVFSAAVGDPLAIGGVVGAVICTLGVAWLAAPRRLADIARHLGDPAAVMGIVAGGMFALAAVGIRVAAGTLGEASTWNRALLTLTAMLGIQTLVNGVQLFVSARDDLSATLRHWRAALPVGVLSLCGSIGWATAVTLTSAAKVRTLGQVEVLIAFAVSIVSLGERHSRAEYLASGLVLVGVIAVVVFG